MKTKLFAVVIIAGVILSACTGTSTMTGNNYLSSSETITYQQFYDGLSPYGRWVNYPGYGYVWMPAESEFRPYSSNGHWSYTNYGWTWVSEYNWGWAPFHYGRWFHDNSYGWMWMPGYDWAPAWVSWRSNSECYGWAPIGPKITIGVSSFNDIPVDQWTFVQHRYINHPRINNYYINNQRNSIIINNTTVINNTVLTNTSTNNNTVVDKRKFYSTGPDAKEVERETKTKLNPLIIRESNSPGRSDLTKGTLNLYKPTIKKSPETIETTKPKEVMDVNDLKTFRQGKAKERNGDQPTNGNTYHDFNKILPAQNKVEARRFDDRKKVNSTNPTESADKEKKPVLKGNDGNPEQHINRPPENKPIIHEQKQAVDQQTNKQLPSENKRQFKKDGVN